jgi:hypothetical protein
MNITPNLSDQMTGQPQTRSPYIALFGVRVFNCDSHRRACASRRSGSQTDAVRRSRSRRRGRAGRVQARSHAATSAGGKPCICIADDYVPAPIHRQGRAGQTSPIVRKRNVVHFPHEMNSKASERLSSYPRPCRAVGYTWQRKLYARACTGPRGRYLSEVWQG